jgi:ectoine hydroxylase-related dioxygenase (phytanoyl-CoA dioxygenase family)
VRIYNLLVHGPLFERIPVHPNVLPVVERVLDPGCLVSSLSSIAIDPGETAQPIHADDQLIPLPKPHPPVVCNTMWAVTDFTEANGATRLVPGSHLADRSPDLRRALRLHRRRDAARLGARLARQPVARRRRQHQRRAGSASP